MIKILTGSLFVILTLCLSFSVQSQTPCENGMAGDYPCNEMDLMSHFYLGAFDCFYGNDSWGWTDPETGREYALFCNNQNTSFIDISDPINPIILGFLDTHTGWSMWRDVKVYNNYAFIVSEAPGHGMQVFDLTRLRDIVNPPVAFTEDAHNDSFGGAHNIAINEETGYAYIIGALAFEGGPVFINIQDPLNSINEGGYSDDGYSHDGQIINYNGPDSEHVGKEIYIGANETSVVVVDVTDKENPVQISEMSYANSGYTHQIWVDEEHTYLYCNDEFDESEIGFNTRNVVFDLTDLDNPQLKLEYFGETGAVDHNNYVHNDKLYIANYTAGLRVIDVSDVMNNNMNEIAYFDTHPEDDNVTYDGAWNVYPYFASGNIVISDINKGFFVVRPSNPTNAIDDKNTTSTKISPNPVDGFLLIEMETSAINQIEVFNILGEKVINIDNVNILGKAEVITSSLSEGTYIVKVNGQNGQKFIKK